VQFDSLSALRIFLKPIVCQADLWAMLLTASRQQAALQLANVCARVLAAHSRRRVITRRQRV
jgi:hypothetical protein